MTYSHNLLKQPIPITDPVEILLADVAIRVQLSATKHNTAIGRLETLGEHADRPGSPLFGKIKRIYAQGSMAIGGTIDQGFEDEEFDIDGMVEVDLPRTVDPEDALSLLHVSIVGTPQQKTRYWDMTKRHTRCVQIYYGDGMHVDLTPTVLLPEYEERTGFIFHSKPEDPNEQKQRLYANPYGLAEYFKANTPQDVDFATFFEKRAMAFDHMMVALEKAEIEEVPEHEPVYQKSRALIALQLIKRWRNRVYRKYPSMRMPPSVLMAYWVATHANKAPMPTLLGELIHQVRSMTAQIESAEATTHDGLVHVTNPHCPKDVLTDRWPENQARQKIFKNELAEFMDDLTKLERQNLSVPEIQVIMMKLFGEKPVKESVERFFQQQGQHHQNGGGRVTPKATNVVIAGPGIITPSYSDPIPRHNFFGGTKKR